MSGISESFEWVTRGDGKARESLLNRLNEQLTQHGWTPSEIFGMQMAVEESVSNAYQHGNQQGTLGDVTVRWRVSELAFSVEVHDNGGGFDLAAVPNPTTPENLEQPGGRGLLLMRGYMDHVEYTDGGRKVVMQKTREQATSE